MIGNPSPGRPAANVAAGGPQDPAEAPLPLSVRPAASGAASRPARDGDAARRSKGTCRRHLENLLLPFGIADAGMLSRRLIDEFGSLAGTLAAPHARRDSLLVDHPEAALHLGHVRTAMLHALRAGALAGARISGVAALARYLQADMGCRTSEQLRILFLAAHNRLLADEVFFQGSIDAAPLLPRPIVHRALDLGATAMILVHNHPSGDPAPSPADIAATRVFPPSADRWDSSFTTI